LFRTHAQSPLPVAARRSYDGVPYYDYDPAYRLIVRVEPVETGRMIDSGPIALPTSGDEPFAFQRVGRVTLGGPLGGAQLSLFWIEGYAGGLFLPFRDATSGTETYGAGRYLLDSIKGADLGASGATGASELVLDFNMAYHPSCVYDPRWNCPLSPPENRLPIPVRVGERLANL